MEPPLPPRSGSGIRHATPARSPRASLPPPDRAPAATRTPRTALPAPDRPSHAEQPVDRRLSWNPRASLNLPGEDNPQLPPRRAGSPLANAGSAPTSPTRTSSTQPPPSQLQPTRRTPLRVPITSVDNNAPVALPPRDSPTRRPVSVAGPMNRASLNNSGINLPPPEDPTTPTGRPLSQSVARRRIVHDPLPLPPDNNDLPPIPDERPQSIARRKIANDANDDLPPIPDSRPPSNGRQPQNVARRKIAQDPLPPPSDNDDLPPIPDSRPQSVARRKVASQIDPLLPPRDDTHENRPPQSVARRKIVNDPLPPPSDNDELPPIPDERPPQSVARRKVASQIDPLLPPRDDVPQNWGQARAIYGYYPPNDDDHELTFDIGTVIEVTWKDHTGWWEGKLPSGQIGVFPSNHVEAC